MVPAVAMDRCRLGCAAVGIAAGFNLPSRLRHFNNGKKLISTARAILQVEQHLYNEKAGPYAKLTPEEALGCSPSASRVDDLEHS
jgi:hypothetical protein